MQRNTSRPPHPQVLAMLALVGFFARTFLVGTPSVAETWFGPPVTFEIPETPTALSVGHLNDDPYIDCAVGARTGGSESIYVMLNNGLGQFSISAVLPVTNSWTDLEVGDFNGDGRDDIAFCENPLKVYYADVNYDYPGPSVSVTWPTSNFFHRMATADLDGDGFDDLVGRYPGGPPTGRVFVLFGSPTGLITPPLVLRANLVDDFPECDPITYFTSVYDIVLDDMDGDGDPDIAVSCEYENGAFCGGEDRLGIGYFEHYGGRNFEASVTWIRKNPGASGIYWEPFDIAELTGDGLPDALCEVADVSVHLLRGVSNGEWIESPLEELGNGDPRLYDLNLDTEADVVKTTLHTYEIFRGDGFGEFDWIQSIPDRPGHLVAVDVDGLPGAEILGTDSPTKRLLVFPNISATAASVGSAPDHGARLLRVTPTVVHGASADVWLSLPHQVTARSLTAHVIDVRGARRATIELRRMSGGGYGAPLPLDGILARSGTYWIHVPASGADAARFTLVR